MRLASWAATYLPGIRRFAGSALRWTRRALAVYGLLVLVYVLGFEVSRYQKNPIGHPLVGTNLEDGDMVLSERISLGFRNPQRYDVVSAIREDGTHCIRRVFGLPGEKVSSLDRRHLSIDGQRLTLPESLSGMTLLAYGNLADYNTVACKDGYYVLGDPNREYYDSRFEGPIPLEQITGHPWLILWPWRRFGFVNP